MGTTTKIIYIPEETATLEIKNFINDGLKNVQNNDLYDFNNDSNGIHHAYG
ncbi:hypothetical protein ACIZ62_16615 [Acetobacterium carbinolicum]|jgi:hypothetical protein|uniref:hypothetical protein n=1 Tax=Acetobacterium carbinolicum TaxID=52690 RepID=UPI0039BF5F20